MVAEESQREEGWEERMGERGKLFFKSVAFEWIWLGEQSFTVSSRR